MQTATEYFDEQIQERVIAQDVVARKMIIEISMEDYMDIKRQAKEMEFRQRESDFIAGGKSAFNASQGKDFKTFEEYINS